MAKMGQYRRKQNRCEAVLSETRKKTGKPDSWRCDLVLGHSGRHESQSGHRTWAVGETYRAKAWQQDQLEFGLQTAAETLIEDLDDMAALAAFEATVRDLLGRIEQTRKELREHP